MRTYMAKAETVQRQWVVVNAEGMPLGRVASQIAAVLRGKNKPTFTPHVDTGDGVIVVNAAKIVLTGHKLDQKKHYWHTGYVGGIKEVSYRKLMEEKPEFALRLAIKGMLPKNTLGRRMLSKLRVYAGPEHEQQAQKPVALELIK